MTQNFDFVVVGAGGFGSSALFHLAQRGCRVLGIEQFGIAHSLGSSHGETRIIRQAYFEHVNYVPLLKRAYVLWDELQVRTRQSLFHRCGLMITGMPHSIAVNGTLAAARQYQLEVESLPVDEARRRFPCYQFRDDFGVAFEQNAGFLNVENCVAALLKCATDCGAELRIHEKVLEIVPTGNSVRITTNRDTYFAGKVVVTAGAWTSQLLAELSVPLRVLRKPMFWYEAAGDLFRPENNPCFFFDLDEGQFYGFPQLDGRTIKVAEHTGGQTVIDPSTVDRELTPDDTRPVHRFLKNHLSVSSGQMEKHAVCLYTMSPDHHFIVDHSPMSPQIVLAAGFSGHGFKFTTVLGEALADLATQGQTPLPIGFLGLNRFLQRPTGESDKKSQELDSSAHFTSSEAKPQ